jgi:hypothetical protein
VTYRGHGNVWVGWTEMARWLRAEGVRLDTTYIPERAFRIGYLNGSGLPVQFVDEHGSLLDIYEQATLHTEPGLLTDKYRAPALDLAGAIEVTKALADAAIDRFHAVYQPNFHPVYFRAGARDTLPWLAALIAHCRTRGFHFVGGAAWLRFNEARRRIRLTASRFDAASGALELTLTAELPVAGATLIFPFLYRGRAMAGAALDGEPVSIAPQQLEGRPQVLLPADYAAGRPRRWRIRWGE